MALNSLYCADVPLSNSLTHSRSLDLVVLKSISSSRFCSSISFANTMTPPYLSSTKSNAWSTLVTDSHRPSLLSKASLSPDGRVKFTRSVWSATPVKLITMMSLNLNTFQYSFTCTIFQQGSYSANFDVSATFLSSYGQTHVRTPRTRQ